MKCGFLTKHALPDIKRGKQPVSLKSKINSTSIAYGHISKMYICQLLTIPFNNKQQFYFGFTKYFVFKTAFHF